MTKHSELTERIQAVLDGVATPGQALELERLLAADPSARAEFEQWHRLFVALDRVPQASPPEGLVAAITAAASQRLDSIRDFDQLSESADVIGYRHPEGRRSVSWIGATIRRPSRSGPRGESWNMSEQQQRIGFGTRKLWVGGALSALVVAVAMIGFDLPPKSESIVGTIAPAERYRAPQDNTEAVKLGDQTIAQLLQNDGFDKLVKDPQMKALSQDANVRMLATVLARVPAGTGMTMLQNISASQAAAENVALAKAMLGNVELSRAAFADLKANRVPAADRAVLARMMSLKLDAANAILSSIEASRYASSNPQLALAIAGNAEASRILLSTEASRSLNSAEAGLMLKAAEASRMKLDKAVAERLQHE